MNSWILGILRMRTNYVYIYVYYIYILYIYLVGGIPTPLKNDGVNVSWDDDIPN